MNLTYLLLTSATFHQTQPPSETNIPPDFSNLPPQYQTKSSTELQLQYHPTTPFNYHTNTWMYTSKPSISKPTPAIKSKPATSQECISPPLTEAISDASSILKNFTYASNQQDECDHYGSLITYQLRELSPRQKALVTMEFNQDGSTGMMGHVGYEHAREFATLVGENAHCSNLHNKS